MKNNRTQRSRFLRSSLRTLLLLPVLFAAGWWWLTWPERTATSFVNYLAAGNQESAQNMFDGPPLDDFWPREIDELSSCTPPQIQPPTWHDLLHGRRTFAAQESPGRVLHFEALRNSVNMDKLSVVYDANGVSAEELVQVLSVVFARTDIAVTQSKNSRQLVVAVRRENLEHAKLDADMPQQLRPGNIVTKPSPVSAELIHQCVSQILKATAPADKQAN